MGYSASATLTATANDIYGAILSPAAALQAASPGQVAPHTLRVTNTVNTAEMFAFGYEGHIRQ